MIIVRNPFNKCPIVQHMDLYKYVQPNDKQSDGLQILDDPSNIWEDQEFWNQASMSDARLKKRPFQRQFPLTSYSISKILQETNTQR